MLDLGEFRDVYFEECEDLFAVLETQLENLRDGRDRDDAINEIFRAVHSVKGGAGALRIDRIVKFAHKFETFFDLARKGELELNDVTVDLAYTASDILVDLVNEERSPGKLPVGAEDRIGEKLDKVVEIISRDGDGPSSGAVPVKLESATVTVGEGPNFFEIRYQPDIDDMRCGTEPLFLFRELQSFGTLTLNCDAGAVPLLDALDPLALHLSWIMQLETESTRDDIEEVFEFVAGNGSVVITEHDGSAPTTVAEAEESVPATSMPLADKVPTGPNGVQPKTRPPTEIAAATIRVDLERVDKLVNLVGQIAISQTLVTQHLDEQLSESHPGLVEEIEQLQQYTQALQDGVMAIRALPVGLIFSRLPKLVRELSRTTSKPVALEMSGEETEIDKTVIEQLYDPLMHMIRNAIDHGIEKPEKRRAAGKPEQGRISLSAWQTGGKIVIRLQDDGAGINRERVQAIAIQNGMISPDAELSNEEIDRLIMTPGFSTADEISEISGRGVGMDVVCQNIHRLGGQVSIQSERGKGTSVTMALPLTLAVMDGMAVRVANERYVIPITAIIQSMPLNQELIKTVPGEGEVMRFRNNYVKLVRLESVFGIPVGSEQSDRLVVLLELEGTEVAVVVDEIIGQLQVVTKTLEQNFKPVPGIAAATIMGDGEVALILDPQSIALMRPSKGTISAAPVKAAQDEEVQVK